MTLQPNDEQNSFLRELGLLEEACGTVATGGFVVDCGWWKGGRPASDMQGAAFARFIELWRRSKGWTVERFSIEARVDIVELLVLEMGSTRPAEPRTIYQLAGVTGVPVGKLMDLAGLSSTRDPQVGSAAVRFAAQSESMAKLTREEEDALQALLRFLTSEQR